MEVVTDIYQSKLPALPQGWRWYIRKDVIDGFPKVIVYLKDQNEHAKGHDTIDVSMYGSGSAVIELARGSAERAGL